MNIEDGFRDDETMQSSDPDISESTFRHKNAVLRGGLKSKTTIKKVTRTDWGHRTDEKVDPSKKKRWTLSRKQAIQTLEAMRRQNGLETRTGFVKMDTAVLLDTVAGLNLRHHSFFHNIPMKCLRSFSMEKNHRLRQIEDELSDIRGSKIGWHRYGANGGFNLGMSITDGGRYARGGYSGGIHHGRLLKDRPILRKKLHDLVGSIMQEAFGACLWYRRMVHLCSRLNEQSKEERTIPGSPYSAIWWSTVTKSEAVHCDENIVGPIFILTTYEAESSSASLCFLSDKSKLTQCDMQPGKILAGKWGSNPHCNVKMDERAAATRTSLTIYLDGRVFGRNYRFVYPRGYK